MLTLYSYPHLFGVADNNPFGLKVYTFMRLCGMAFKHCHILDTKNAPRGQLPYLTDGEHSIGDSDEIIAYLTDKFGLTLDAGLTAEDRRTDLMLRRTLDDLYWSMSYSRWRDDRYWPVFRDAIMSTHPDISLDALDAAREYNRLRYHYQGVGRYEPGQVYARGVADLRAAADVLGDKRFVFGDTPSTADAALFGFVANIYFYDIDTPLKRYVLSRPELVGHCTRMREQLALRPAPV
ncbi:glutathione S-transferase C-terminal domain-containing protein [Bordetella bronchialis]|uniref:Glutathione S-transferase n=1 Tax=Bordetella bronchialis TaxID=463025 RepID=A0ABM6CNC2_9BORD|nr:glutathione S-transferase C-terminal domain-containing protein [Bordetella bronchialis]ANN65414.1 glutathione S-transferase [Bordetella bronchialis]